MIKKKVYFLISLLAFAIVSSCSSDDNKQLLENQIEIDGRVYTINGGFIDGDHELSEDYVWDFNSIITLYGGGIDYDPAARKFIGKGWVLQMRMHSGVHGLELGNYTYSESGARLTFNESFYTTNFDVNSDENQIEAFIVSGKVSVDRENEYIINFHLVDSNNKEIRGFSRHYMF